MKKISRVAAYIRVSSEEQADKGYSLTAQRARLTEYAKQNNLKIVDWYEDAGVSGHQPIKRRPELQRMIRDAEKGLFDQIIFIKIDRFFRRMSEYYECMRRIAPVSWIATEEQHDFSTAIGEAHFNIALSFAQMEARQTGERIIFNNTEKVKAGYAINGKPSLPFGFTTVGEPGKKRVVKDPDEAHIAQEIIDYYLVHQNKLKTRRHIKEKFGVDISNRVISVFLKNELLYGKYRENTEYCEPYIDRDTFDRIQTILQRRKRHDGTQKYNYVLSSLVKCPVCGNSLSGYQMQNKRSYGPGVYVYPSYRCHHHYNKDSACSFSKRITESRLERQLLEHIEEHLNQQIILQATIQEQNRKKPAVDVDKIYAQIDRLNYSWQTGKIRTVEQYEEQYDALNTKLQEALKDCTVEPVKDYSHIEKILCAGWRDIYSALDNVNKNKFWSSFIESIEIDFETKQITSINFF